MTMKRRRKDDLGIVLPPRKEARALSVRMSLPNLHKLEKLAKRLDIGPSTMARLILEKFIEEHDPDAK
jgi:hypothetical protein